MNFKAGDLVVCLAHEGLGRIVSAKRGFGLCRVQWSPHSVSEHPKDELLKTGSTVTTKDGVTGKVIALSPSRLKIMLPSYETIWAPLADLVRQRANCPGVPAKATEVSRRDGPALAGIGLKSNRLHSEEQTCESLLGGQARQDRRVTRGATR